MQRRILFVLSTLLLPMALSSADLFAQEGDSAIAQFPALELTPEPFDFERWARFVVHELLEAQPYEKYVLMFDPSYYPEFADALRSQFLEVRAVELGAILFDGRKVAGRRRAVQPRDSDPEYKRLSNEAMRRLFEEADIYLWLPFRYGPGSEREDRRLFEHMIDGLPIRGLHFHWVWLS